MKEQTITLQFGSLSNSVGAHLWNIRNNNRDVSSETLSLFHRVVNTGPNISHTTYCPKIYPRAIMVDVNENINNPSRVVSTDELLSTNKKYLEESTIWNAPTDVHFQDNSCDIHKESFYRRWKSWIEFDIDQSKSMSPLPRWINKSNFNTFHSGTNSEYFNNEYMDIISEQYRYFAEECDYLSSVVVIADVYNGYGGLATKVLEAIGDDSKCRMQIFALTSPLLPLNQQPLLQQGTLSGTLKSLNSPFAYSKMLEYSNLIIPVDPYLVSRNSRFESHTSSAMHGSKPNDSDLIHKYNVSAVIAASIEALLSPVSVGFQPDYQQTEDKSITHNRMKNNRSLDTTHNYDDDNSEQYVNIYQKQRDILQIQHENINSSTQRKSTSRLSMFDWSSLLTANQRFPFLKFETSIPSPLLRHRTSSSDLEKFFLKYFQDSREGVITPANVLNPFLKSLSAVDSQGTMTSSVQMTRRKRAFTNLLVFRGESFRSNLESKFFEKCVGGTYALSSCMQCTAPLLRPSRFPKILDNGQTNHHEVNCDSELELVSVGVGAGADSSVGEHLHEMANRLIGLGYHASGGGNSMRNGGYSTTDGSDDDENMYDSASIGGLSGLNASKGRTGGSVNIRSQLESVGLETEECMQLIEALTDCAHRYE